eukprot:06600.XXX_294278_294553_1 [CDS] Oithona nana genome sequencing.
MISRLRNFAPWTLFSFAFAIQTYLILTKATRTPNFFNSLITGSADFANQIVSSFCHNFAQRSHFRDFFLIFSYHKQFHEFYKAKQNVDSLN